MLDPATFSAGRFAIASLAFSPFLWRALKIKQLGSAGFELGVLASIGYLTQCIGLVTTEAGHASFISTFTVIVVPIISGILGVKIPKITWAAAAVSLLGVGLLESSGSNVSVGDLWSFVSAVFFGIHMLRTEHHSRKLPSDASMPLLSLQLFVIAFFSTFWSLWNNADLRAFALNPQAFNIASLSQAMAAVPWHPMLYTGLMSTAFPLWIELVSMRDVSATEAAVIYTLEPLWGAGFAWSLLGERWGAAGWIGALLILGGSLTVQLFGRVEEPPCMAISVMDLTKNEPNGLLCTEVFTEKLERKAQDVMIPKSLAGHRRARSKLWSKKF
ncbi:hypothetical protein O6H91_12G087100 [Diphasiastrum complanatum]|nr:hypothetical protein O6H91_Y578100 [Diphasiastrum complanatum]KAJ7536891.1 hypothetical protein O6H91_12G087100 [Diphasiastrum complanatum]